MQKPCALKIGAGKVRADRSMRSGRRLRLVMLPPGNVNPRIGLCCAEVLQANGGDFFEGFETALGDVLERLEKPGAGSLVKSRERAGLGIVTSASWFPSGSSP